MKLFGGKPHCSTLRHAAGAHLAPAPKTKAGGVRCITLYGFLGLILLSCGLFAGTTYAWFTQEISSGTTQIRAGFFESASSVQAAPPVMTLNAAPTEAAEETKEGEEPAEPAPVTLVCLFPTGNVSRGYIPVRVCGAVYYSEPFEYENGGYAEQSYLLTGISPEQVTVLDAIWGSYPELPDDGQCHTLLALEGYLSAAEAERIANANTECGSVDPKAEEDPKDTPADAPIIEEQKTAAEPQPEDEAVPPEPQNAERQQEAEIPAAPEQPAEAAQTETAAEETAEGTVTGPAE